jgi:hypothetical protein
MSCGCVGAGDLCYAVVQVYRNAFESCLLCDRAELSPSPRTHANAAPPVHASHAGAPPPAFPSPASWETSAKTLTWMMSTVARVAVGASASTGTLLSSSTARAPCRRQETLGPCGRRHGKGNGRSSSGMGGGRPASRARGATMSGRRAARLGRRPGLVGRGRVEGRIQRRGGRGQA